MFLSSKKRIYIYKRNLFSFSSKHNLNFFFKEQNQVQDIPGRI